MIRVGMVGCGVMSGAYLREMASLAGRLKFTGLVDIDLQRARKAAASSPVAEGARCATSTEEILDDVDAVVLAVPHDLHRDLAITCLEAGKHVLVEKPLANTERQCLDLVEAADRSGCVAMATYVTSRRSLSSSAQDPSSLSERPISRSTSSRSRMR